MLVKTDLKEFLDAVIFTFFKNFEMGISLHFNEIKLISRFTI